MCIGLYRHYHDRASNQPSIFHSFQMYLNNLTTNKVYDLRIQAGTRSQVGERIMHFGLFSETKRLLLQPGK